MKIKQVCPPKNYSFETKVGKGQEDVDKKVGSRN